jgi:hypothetical protein
MARKTAHKRQIIKKAKSGQNTLLMGQKRGILGQISVFWEIITENGTIANMSQTKFLIKMIDLIAVMIARNVKENY